MPRPPKPLYRIGDLVACYGNTRHMDKTAPQRLIVGWIEGVYLNNLKRYVYQVCWSDRIADNYYDLMNISEEQMPPLVRLVDSIRNGTASATRP